MEAIQMQPRAPDQSHQAMQQLRRRHDDMYGAVAVGAFKPQRDLASAVAFEPFVGNGRAGDVTAQPFEFLALTATGRKTNYPANVRLG